MSDRDYKCLLVSQENDGYVRRVVRRSVDTLPEGDVLIRVHYSSLNYKDALSATGHPGVTRRYPHTPGIDAAGVVEESSDGRFTPGDEVIVTSYDLGANTPGGYGQYIRVRAGWIVPLPSGLTLRESMVYGTAGFTAAMSLHRLERHGVDPGSGEILVTGATGGVGSLSVAILARLGYTVVAATGKPERERFLLDLGANAVVPRDEVDDESGRPLLAERWAGVVDTAGGNLLATALKSTRSRGIVTCCGLVASADLNISVYPFILRGVSLHGIDSAECPMPERKYLWDKIAGPWKIDSTDDLVTERTLETLEPEIQRILKGRQTGRVVVNLTEKLS
ncbi:MAG: YhdH/YhfP family quinone oxidoreductase [Gemmatimonadota bacterium]|nr:YhdH/YhfP family quinone oxidoreductase [Gemmatimonadota bacterium]